MMPAGFDSLRDAVRTASSPPLAIYALARGNGASEHLALAEVFRWLCKERREDCASASVLAASWIRGEMLPGMWEAAETYANELLKLDRLAGNENGVFLDLEWELSQIPRRYRTQARAIWDPESLDALLERQAEEEQSDE